MFGVSITELLSGNAVENINISANMFRSKFYVCPICGNIFHSMGEAVIQCHGVQLTPAQAEETDENHIILIEKVEDDYFVQIDHEMTKKHYISFVAAMSSDNMQMIKLYPEGNAEVRFPTRGVRKLFFYCNRDGLFSININKKIHGREKSYDDVEERRALEAAAKMLLG